VPFCLAVFIKSRRQAHQSSQLTLAVAGSTGQPERGAVLAAGGDGVAASTRTFTTRRIEG
jgi:hypothetical protein